MDLKVPNIAIYGMKVKETCDAAFKQKVWIKPLRWFDLMQLPALERWKN